MANFEDALTKALNPLSPTLVKSVREPSDRLAQTAQDVEAINATADARLRPYREAQRAFYDADRAFRDQRAAVVAQYGEPQRKVVETRVGGDAQQRDAVSAGRVYTYGTTVPVVNPEIMRAFIFRDLEYQRHLAHARLLKVELATMPENASTADYAHWVLRALSTVSKAMMALNLAPAQGKAGALGTLGAWAQEHGAPIDTERANRYGWPLLPQLQAVNGQTPSGNGRWWQNRVGWSGLFWTMEGSDANLAEHGYAVGFPKTTYYTPQMDKLSWRVWNERYPNSKVPEGFMSEEAIAGDPNAYIRDVDAFRAHLATMFAFRTTGTQDRSRATQYASQWLDWLLSIGSAGQAWTSYFTGWIMREFNTDANSAFGPNMPVTLYDFSKIADDISIAAFSFVSQIVSLIQLAISAVSSNYGGVLSSLESFSATAVDLGSSGYSRGNFRWFHNPFIRWFSVPELNLDASNPSTETMVARLFNTALPNYQNKLGIDFGLKRQEAARRPPPAEPPPQTDLYKHGPPPIDSKPIPWGTIGLIGAGVVGGAALLRLLRNR